MGARAYFAGEKNLHLFSFLYFQNNRDGTLQGGVSGVSFL